MDVTFKSFGNCNETFFKEMMVKGVVPLASTRALGDALQSSSLETPPESEIDDEDDERKMSPFISSSKLFLKAAQRRCIIFALF